MKTRYKNMCVCAVAIAVMFALVSTVYAQAEGPQKEGYRKEKIEQFAEKLGLTPEQSEALKEKRQAYRTQKKEIEQTLRKKREELRKELEAATSDVAKLESIANEIKMLQGQLIDLRIENVLATKEILTPEQLEKMHQMQSQRKGHKKRGGHYRGMWQKRFDKQPDE